MMNFGIVGVWGTDTPQRYELFLFCMQLNRIILEKRAYRGRNQGFCREEGGGVIVGLGDGRDGANEANGTNGANGKWGGEAEKLGGRS